MNVVPKKPPLFILKKGLYKAQKAYKPHHNSYYIVVTKMKKKTLLTLLLAGTLGFLSPKLGAQTFYPSLDSKINPFKQPNQSKTLIWDNISTRAQKEALLNQYLAEDKTDEIAYVSGQFESGNFAKQLNINFYGTSGYQIIPDPNFIYDTTNIEKFNIPLFTANRSSSSGGHGLNAILVGDNPLDWNSWAFVEPQTDAIVQPGSQSIPLNSKIEIKQNYWNYNGGNVSDSQSFLKFFLKDGKVDSVWNNLKLLLENNFAPGKFKLVSPENNAKIPSRTEAIDFSWEKSVDRDIADVIKYDKIIRNKNTGIEKVISDIPDTSRTASPGLLTRGDYEWFVAAKDGKETTYSDTLEFSIGNSQPTASSFISPAEGDILSGNLGIQCKNSTDADNDKLKHLLRIKNIEGQAYDTLIVTENNAVEIEKGILKPGRYSLEGKTTDGIDTIDFDNSREFVIPASSGVGVERLPGQLPNKSSLGQNYPNPFNPVTKIRYSLKKTEDVSLKVYDMLGREVKTLVNSHMPSGNYEVDFYASKLASGVYFYRLKAGDFVETKKMVVGK